MSLCFDGGKQALQIEEQLASRFTVNREHYLPFARDERSYEVHREYIDVQFVREGCEDILLSWSLRTQEQPVFDPARDIAFYSKKPAEDLLVHLRPGIFCVIFPFEAHMPCIRPDKHVETVQKCVAKIPMSAYIDDPLLFTRLFTPEVNTKMR
ncbi:MAG: YhcH/YjgK/YiaL family protein [Desulfovibrio sp.]|nr:YhcH/YjgK/YiaL family protein [Desulfovibrio sp.]